MQTKIRGDDKPPDLTLLGDNVVTQVYSHVLSVAKSNIGAYGKMSVCGLSHSLPQFPGIYCVGASAATDLDIFKLQPHDYRDLILAAKTVSQALRKG